MPQAHGQLVNGLEFSAQLNKNSLLQEHGVKQHETMDKDEHFKIQEIPSQEPSSVYDSIVLSPFSALPGDNATTFPEALFPHVLTPSLENVDFPYTVTSMDHYMDFGPQADVVSNPIGASSDQHGQVSH
jgi:hypothetical protein